MNANLRDAEARKALLQRVTDILLRPVDTWHQIDVEDGDIARIYKSYVLILAALPALAGFIGTSLVGVGGFGAPVRVPILAGLVHMVVNYALSLVMIYVMALIANALAPSHQGRQDMGSAVKLAAYGGTAAMASGVFGILPALGALAGLLGALYSVYLLYTGIPVLMKCPADKAIRYTALLLVGSVVAGLVLGFVASLVTPGQNIDMTASARQAGQEQSAATAAQAAAEAMSAMLDGSGAGAAFEPQQLRDALPARMGNLDRTAIEARSDNAMGMQFSTVKARYAADGERLEIEIQDLGAASSLLRMSVDWINSTADSEDEVKVERIYRQDGIHMHEQYRKDGSSADLEMMLENGVMLKLSGNVWIDELKRLAAPLASELGALERQGK